MPNGSLLSTTSPGSTCWRIATRRPSHVALIREVVRRSSGPVIVAGSIASIDRAVAVSEAGAWGYTIGSAIFDGLLPGAPSIADQVRRVLEDDRQRGCVTRNPDVGSAECPAELCSPTGCVTSCWRR